MIEEESFIRQRKRQQSRAPRGSRPLLGVNLLLPRELALSASVFAFIPFHELAVLHHVFSDQGHGILPVIVEGDIADDGAAVLYIAERRSHVLSVGTDL